MATAGKWDKYMKNKLAGFLTSWFIGSLVNAILFSVLLGGTAAIYLLSIACAALQTLVVIEFIPTRKLDITGRAVLVTGCDSGFGNKLARMLDKMGVKVYAGCLFKESGGEGAKSLEGDCSSNLVTLQLDVTNQEQIDVAYAKVKQDIAETGLWGVVNNAGVSTFGDIELCTMSQYQKMMDVNMFGMLRVTKKFLPLVRKCKGRIVCTSTILGRRVDPGRSAYAMSKHAVEAFATTLRYETSKMWPGIHGRVVSVSSGLSRLSHAGRSAYCMSKYANEAFMDSLRYETKRWQIQVSLITPGNYLGATGILTPEGIRHTGELMCAQCGDEVREAYGGEEGCRRYVEDNVAVITSYLKQGTPDVSPVINSYVSALTDEMPKARYYPTGLYWRVKIFAFTHLPEALAEYIYM